MPYTKLWVHMVWATKRRKPLMNQDIRRIIFEHILANTRKKQIHLDHIGGYTDHVHCLISMTPTQCLKDIAQLIKGESANWVNRQDLLSEHFGWQEEYFAASVSHERVDHVRAYIRNQEVHHATMTFQEEYHRFLKKHGFVQY